MINCVWFILRVQSLIIDHNCTFLNQSLNLIYFKISLKTKLRSLFDLLTAKHVSSLPIKVHEPWNNDFVQRKSCNFIYSKFLKLNFVKNFIIQLTLVKTLKSINQSATKPFPTVLYH